MLTLLERKDERGIYRVLFTKEGFPGTAPLGGPREPSIYADIARYDGTGYLQRCGSYVEACRIVFDEYGYTPSSHAKRSKSTREERT